MEKQGWEESEKKKGEERISEKRKSQKKEDAGRAKVETSRNCAFPMFAALESKSRLAKAAGAEPYGEMRDEKLDAVVAHISMSKCEKRLMLENFWKFQCLKSARHCDAKHM